ncbi:MAG: hypothetical protein QF464_03885 [Myxococcota bacterium]|jgi:hypothetical protein|nr:hypothetical protein [Myxococcota bacterium]
MTTRFFAAGLGALCLALVGSACSDVDLEASDPGAPSFATEGSDRGHSTPERAPSEDAVVDRGAVEGASPPSSQPCVSVCVGKTCGGDGCGGSCGTCDDGFACDLAGQCVCDPLCDGKVCGDDGCGDTCGACVFGSECDDSGHCVCVTDCVDRECGGDGCGGSCGVCTSVEICSDLGTCVPDPMAGCGGLDLAEDWTGTFSGEYAVSILEGLFTASDGDTDGTLSFSITCLNSKFIVSGQIIGVANDDNPFELTLTGTYNPTTGVLAGLIPEGHVYFEDLLGLELQFAGEAPALLESDDTFSGTYAITATTATNALGPVDISTVEATSEGTWTAAPAP